MTKLKKRSIFSSHQIRSISKFAKTFITGMLEGDYFVSILKILYVNVISPHITLALHSIMTKLKKRSIFSSGHIRSISKFAKIFLTRMLEGDYYGLYFVNILCEYDLPTYYPNFTFNNVKVQKKIYIL